MPTKYDNRRRKLQRLIAELNRAKGKGGLSALVRRTGLGHSTLHNALHEKPVNPSAGMPRRSHTHQLGDGAAQTIEAAFGFAKDWLSEPVVGDLVPGPGPEGRNLIAWVEGAVASGVLSEVDATLERASLSDLYPGVPQGQSSQSVWMATEEGMNVLVLGTSGAGKTNLLGLLQH